MMIRGYSISARLLGMIAGVILLIVAVTLLTRSCDKRRSQGAQSRVDASQGQAAANSSADAIGTVSRSGEAQAASEAQSRQAEQEIRAAEGASQSVNPAVRNAGIQALCRRATYKDDPRCKAR